MTSVSTRDRILDAAMAIVRDQGVARLTLDEAAKVAGISKGGVLYHFKSKDALIEGLVAKLTESCASLRQQYLAKEPEGPNRAASATIRAAFDPAGPGQDPIGGALLAAFMVNPSLLKPLEDHMLKVRDEIKTTCADPMLCFIACLAMDGLWLHSVMKTNVCDDTERERVQQRILKMLEVGEGAE